MSADTREELDESNLIRSVVHGIVAAVIVVAALTVLIMRIGAPGRGWGDAFAIAAFMGPWSGVFFGSVAGVGAFEARRQRAERAAAPRRPIVTETEERLAA